MNMTSKPCPNSGSVGIDGYTRYYTYSYLRDIGYTKVLEYILGDNGPSLRASRQFLKEICRIRYVQLLGCNPIQWWGETRITCLNTHH